MTKGPLSAARLMRDISRLKRAIFLVEFGLLAALFAYGIHSQFQLTQARERESVSAHLDNVVEKSRVLIAMAGKDADIASGDPVRVEQGLREVPLQKIIDLEGYAAASVTLGGTVLGHAEDSRAIMFDPKDLFRQMTGAAPLKAKILTTWFWQDGVPYLASAGALRERVTLGRAGDGIPIMLLVMRFDKASLAKLAPTFQIPPMTSRPVRDGAYNNGVQLEDANGRRVGAIVWNSRLDGSMRLIEWSLVVAAVTIVLFAIGRLLVSRMSAFGLVLDQIHEANLREKSRLRSLIEASNDGLLVLDAQGKILGTNEIVHKRSGYRKSEMIGQNISHWLEGIALDDPEFISGRKTFRCQLKKKNGELYWLEVGGGRFADNETEEHYIIVSRDVSARVEAEEEVRHNAHFDVLTDLPNRLLFNTRLNGELMRASVDKTICVLMFVDLDGFKSVNDTHGHDIGDMLLLAVANRFRAHVPGTALVARLGGDEFGVVLPAGMSMSAAISLAETLGSELARPYDLRGVTAHISASIGIAHAPGDGRSTSDLLRAADKAMYMAKRAAGGGYAVAGKLGGEDGDNDGYRAVKRYS